MIKNRCYMFISSLGTVRNRLIQIQLCQVHILYIRSKNNPSGYDMDKHVSFYTEKTLDTFNTLTATRVSDEILFQATWCATVVKHILLGTAIDILLTRVAITRKNNLPRYLFSSLHELRFLTCYFCHHFTRTVRTFVE